VVAPDPLSGGLLYFSYTPYVGSYGGAPADPTGTRSSQTWLWRDGHFTKQSPARAPHIGGPLLMVSDARIGRVVLAGSSGRLWDWTGTTWQQLATGCGPKTGTAAVYDPALGDLIVLATIAGTASPASQTWLWNGKQWSAAP
jgi:hypothetical protein